MFTDLLYSKKYTDLNVVIFIQYVRRTQEKLVFEMYPSVNSNYYKKEADRLVVNQNLRPSIAKHALHKRYIVLPN